MSNEFDLCVSFFQRVDVARVLYGLFAAEVLLELRFQVEGTYLVLCAARPMHC